MYSYNKKNIVFLIALTPMLAAVGYILKVVGQITTTDAFSIRLSDIPIMFSGIITGPIFGALTGFIVDILYLITYGYGFNLMTITSIMWGLIPGLYFMFFKYKFRRLIVVVIITSIVCFSINTYQLYLWQDEAYKVLLPYRAGIAILKLPIQIFTIDMLYKRLYNYIKKVKEVE